MSYRAMIAAMLLPAAACCTAPVLEENYTTPESTLLTFHEAFKHEQLDREYRCFSQRFKKEHGNMDLKSYYDLRRILEEEYPVEAFLFSLQDLQDNIVQVSPGSELNTTVLKLRVGGRDFTIDFIRETIFRLEFDEGSVEEAQTVPLDMLISEEPGRLKVTLPIKEKARQKLQHLRKILVEKRWKFLDFDFLAEKMIGST